MKIGILALQGAFAEHHKKLTALDLDIKVREIRQKEDFTSHLDGLILPGGESTVIGRLLRDLELYEPIRQEIMAGLPVLGTCAGMILLAREIVNDYRTHLGTMDIAVERNGYGRQLGSFFTEGIFTDKKGRCLGKGIPMTFIRAPKIVKSGSEVEVLAKVNDTIVAARQRNQLVTAFHPELHEDNTIYEYFLTMIISAS